jgi:hypothetical protein
MDFARTVRILHGALLAGVVLLAGLFVFLVRVQGLPPSAPESVGNGLTAATLGLVVVATTVLRRRVPARDPQESADAIWAAAANRGPAIVLWAVTDGACLLALVGYFLTGALAPAVAAGIALVTLFAVRPGHLEGAA